MLKRLLVVLCVVAGWAVLPLQAETLEEVLSRAKACDEAFWGSLTDLSFAMQDADTSVAYYWKQGNLREGAPNTCPVRLMAGDTAWTLENPGDTKMVEGGSFDLGYVKDAKEWYKRTPSTAALGKQEIVDGVKCVSITFKTNEYTETVYVNRETCDLVKRVTVTDYDVWTETNSGFTKIAGGFEIPTQRTSVIERTDRKEEPQTSRITLTDVRVNAGLPDDLFDPLKVAAEKRQ